jgi:phosphatidylglycerophosphatase A
MQWFFLTVGYSGLLPKAPGTYGTLAALPLGVIILALFGPQTLFLATLLATVAGVKMIDAYEKAGGIHDDKRIVIDELAGIWLALCIAPGVAAPFASLLEFENGLALQIVLSFIFFRLFDIKKPSVIGRIDREAKGGLGVMGDDLLAGVAAGIAAAIVWHLFKLALF